MKKAIAEVAALFIGALVYIWLRPHIGLGALLVGAVVVYYVLRPLAYALLGASEGTEQSGKRTEEGDNKGAAQ